MRNEKRISPPSHGKRSEGAAVFSYRATTGFSGLIAITAILLGVQFITGVAAFPL